MFAYEENKQKRIQLLIKREKKNDCSKVWNYRINRGMRMQLKDNRYDSKRAKKNEPLAILISHIIWPHEHEKREVIEAHCVKLRVASDVCAHLMWEQAIILTIFLYIQFCGFLFRDWKENQSLSELVLWNNLFPKNVIAKMKLLKLYFNKIELNKK